MKTVYLHIGLHKTGTSTIQFFLANNREKLAELGYLYPFKQVAHHNLAYLIGDKKNLTYRIILGEI